jgi:hypothetical protein
MKKCCVGVYLWVHGRRWAHQHLPTLLVLLLLDAGGVEEMYLVRHSRVRSPLRWEFEEVADLQHEHRRQFDLVQELRGFDCRWWGRLFSEAYGW